MAKAKTVKVSVARGPKYEKGVLYDYEFKLDGETLGSAYEQGSGTGPGNGDWYVKRGRTEVHLNGRIEGAQYLAEAKLGTKLVFVGYANGQYSFVIDSEADDSKRDWQSYKAAKVKRTNGDTANGKASAGTTRGKASAGNGTARSSGTARRARKTATNQRPTSDAPKPLADVLAESVAAAKAQREAREANAAAE